jgi:hypothetical protein
VGADSAWMELAEDKMKKDNQLGLYLFVILILLPLFDYGLTHFTVLLVLNLALSGLLCIRFRSFFCEI